QDRGGPEDRSRQDQCTRHGFSVSPRETGHFTVNQRRTKLKTNPGLRAPPPGSLWSAAIIAALDLSFFLSCFWIFLPGNRKRKRRSLPAFQIQEILCPGWPRRLMLVTSGLFGELGSTSCPFRESEHDHLHRSLSCRPPAAGAAGRTILAALLAAP